MHDSVDGGFEGSELKGSVMRTYLEIGSSDGGTLNERFAARSNWRGMSVEAVPERFESLHRHERNIYVNAACSVDSNEPIEFHYVPLVDIEANRLPSAARWHGATSIEASDVLREHRNLVRTATVPQVTVRHLVDHPIFTDRFTGRRRMSLLKLDAQPQAAALLRTMLDWVRPTTIVMSTASMSETEGLSIDALLRVHGYEYRGRRGDDACYARPSVILIANMKWSTGSIARDLASMQGGWDIDCLGWDAYPHDLELLLSEYDAVASFLLLTPVVWPSLQRGGVVCCGPVEIDWANNGAPNAEHPLARGPFGFQGRCVGAVSRQIYGMLTREQHAKRVLYTPASARLSRFRRGRRRPVKTLGWVGVPESARSFGVDAKRFAMFEEIARRTGLQTCVTHQRYTYDTMQRFYDEIDLLVCTSMTEGGPLGPFEAIACGVPVISTDVGLVREAESIPKFEDVDGAVKLIERLQADQTLLAACRDQQYREFEQRLSMERLLPLWERFFEACRTPEPSSILVGSGA
jgi:hypothetical protein